MISIQDSIGFYEDIMRISTQKQQRASLLFSSYDIIRNLFLLQGR